MLPLVIITHAKLSEAQWATGSTFGLFICRAAAAGPICMESNFAEILLMSSVSFQYFSMLPAPGARVQVPLQLKKSSAHFFYPPNSLKIGL